MATTIYVTEPGTSVHKQDERLLLRRANRTVGDIPLLNIKQVAIVGRGIEVTTEAMLAIVERNIDLCFFTRNLKFRARVAGEGSMFGQLRFMQARYVDDLARQLALAKVVVQGKLVNQARLLQNDPRSRKIMQLTEGLAVAGDLDSLRGYEGQGAAIYFEGLRAKMPQAREWGFERREFYPPPDPINALLSFGYSLLTREALAAVYLVGLDPYLGFFHAINYGRPSLALDVVEEFRPVVVDSLILDILNRKIIALNDFERGGREVDEEGQEKRPAGLRLNNIARNRFLELYEQRIAEYVLYDPEGRRHTLRRVVELQVRQLASLIKGEINHYRPFLLPAREK